MTVRYSTIGVLLLLTVACSKKEEPAAEATPAAPAPAAPSAARVQIPEADLAVSEDFEEDAEKEISESNYKAELSAIEKELEAPE
jgi:hypothetical protein